MRRIARSRNLLLGSALALFVWGGTEAAPALEKAQPSPAAAPADSGFRQFLQTAWPLAQAKGVRRATFDAAFEGMEPDPAAPSAASPQAEFDKPLKSYLTDAASPQRISRGGDVLTKWKADLAQIEERFGVPGEIVVAAYGVETDFGRAMGGKDIVRSLASLAYRRQDRALFLDELIAALVILDKGDVDRAKMRGSWAGAMGGPQFMPSAYLKYALSYDGSGPPDIWDRPQDILASIAHFLRQSGWRPGLPWGMEVVLPAGFDFSSLHRGFPAFAALGVVSADGRPLPAAGEATLFLPSGAAGPAFLLSENYWVLKAYNNSDSYALSLALLGNRILGRPGLQGRWPAGEIAMSRAQKSEIQTLLRTAGFYRGDIDGRFGQASRDAIHAFQVSARIDPADGFGSPDVLKKLKEQAAAPPGR
ncbi:lytic murein transglycosylase [Methylocapsa palsarum]|uniref:Lytic murein transglycosylase n=1 Tax=Methylocapsa palsarum TaxID=1612308 RepID=A0A1I4C4W1_9HYPH|nr:lytic murein transglycosylase [Methylocapsa palsarum]SFK76112.1 lytic murein transglycosylase [Methylocapsa palsarum]